MKGHANSFEIKITRINQSFTLNGYSAEIDRMFPERNTESVNVKKDGLICQEI